MLRRVIHRLAAGHVLPAWHRQMRGMTLGTRTLVIADEARVMLVKHSYSPGWLLPGGGVERGEEIAHSALREVAEEASIFGEEKPKLMGLCSNHKNFPGDYIAVMLLKKFRVQEFKPNSEIAAAQFFALNQLPGDIRPGSKRRILEYVEGVEPAAHW